MTGGRAKGGYNQRDESWLVAARCLTSSGYRSDGETDNLVCVTGQITHTLTGVEPDASEDGTGRGSPIIPMAFNWQAAGNQTTLGLNSETTGALGVSTTPALATAAGVRRLTPKEYERLMSWPDDWTRWDASGTEFADGPRYRMCGNGVVANVAQWLGRRLVEAIN